MSPASGQAWRRLAGTLWVGVTLVALGAVLAARWDDVRPALAELSAVRVAVSAVLAVAAVGASAGIHRALLAGLGAPLAWGMSARVFFVGQLGKYLPGSVWPLLAQTEMGRRLDIPRRVSAAAVALFMWVHLLTAVAVAALALPVILPVHRAVSLLAVPALALLAPGLLASVVDRLLRLARRPPLPAALSLRHVAGAVAWAALMWVCYGAHLAALVPGRLGLWAAAGVFAGAWAAGFVFLVAPAGAGAREAALTASLITVAGTGPALAAVVVSRLLVTLADGLWGAALLVGVRLRVPRRE